MFLNSTEAWRLLFTCAGIVAGFLFAAHRTDFKQKVPLFYCWLGAIAVLGGAAAFFLPIAVNSGFAKEDDGSALRQALLYTTGGLLGVITLGETHRKNNQEKEKNENDHTRQVYAERRSRYTTAVEQLANEKAAVRLGGIYTLVGLVDEWLADDSLTKEKQQKEGQVIINNLCSYIRSPFPLAEEIEEYEAHKELEKLQKTESEKLREAESSRLQVLLRRFKDSGVCKKSKDITADYAKFHEEQDVRRTIFVEMSKRSSVLSKDEKDGVFKTNPGTWSNFDFDFSRAPIFYPLNAITIEKGNFPSAKFYTTANFMRASFTQTAVFMRASFTQTANFAYAVFASTADFRAAAFTDYSNFGAATFTGRSIFSTATFTKNVNFSGATFTRTADFTSATFTTNAKFDRALFKEKSPFFMNDLQYTRSLSSARFARLPKNPRAHNFRVNASSFPIPLGRAELDGMEYHIPVGTVLFDPDSWDEEKQKYTRVSEPAEPLDESDEAQENMTE